MLSEHAYETQHYLNTQCGNTYDRPLGDSHCLYAHIGLILYIPLGVMIN